ncbi:hypothetical protein KIPB_016369, partial [Kipferlia bialata]
VHICLQDTSTELPVLCRYDILCRSADCSVKCSSATTSVSTCGAAIALQPRRPEAYVYRSIARVLMGDGPSIISAIQDAQAAYSCVSNVPLKHGRVDTK